MDIKQILQVRDKLYNPINKKQATVTRIKENHYYRGDDVYGRLFFISYDGQKEYAIPGCLINRFELIAKLN